MTKYEVRVRVSRFDYYHIEAKSKAEARAFVKAQVVNPLDWSYATLDDTIKREPIIDYAVQLSPEGEVII